MATRGTHRRGPWRRQAIGLLLATLISAFGSAQEVVPPPSSVPQELLGPDRGLGFRIGRVDLYPRASMLAFHDDNIFASSTREESDFIWSVSPGLTAVLGEPTGTGKGLSVDWSSTPILFSDHKELRTVDHAADALVMWPFSKLTLDLRQNFQMRSPAVAGVPDRVKQTSWTTRLGSRYESSAKSSLEFILQHALTRYERSGLIDSREWQGESWMNWDVLPKLALGGGLSAGYLEVDRNGSQACQALSLRGRFFLVPKLDLNVSAGAEHRRYHGSDLDGFSPVFTAGLTYQPRATLNLGLHGSRGERNSAYLAGENYIWTTLTAVVRHIIRERFVWTVTGSFGCSDYHAVHPGLSETRSDHQFAFTPALEWIIRRNVRAGVFCAFRKRASSQPFYDHHGTQTGLHVAWFY